MVSQGITRVNEKKKKKKKRKKGRKLKKKESINNRTKKISFDEKESGKIL